MTESLNDKDRDTALLDEYFSDLLGTTGPKHEQQHELDSKGNISVDESIDGREPFEVGADQGELNESVPTEPVQEDVITETSPKEHPEKHVLLQSKPVKSLEENSHSQQLAEIEKEKKEQLQKLLSSAYLRIPSVVESDVSVSVKPELKIEQAVDVSKQIDVESEIVLNHASARLNPLLQWSENGRPIWGQDRFQALLFEVAGLTMAVPLVALGYIVPLKTPLTQLSGQSDWFMGIHSSDYGDVNVINTAMFVMPERYEANFVERVKYIISIEGCSWGLAVSGLEEPIYLAPEDVKWRTKRTTREWLAGTVKERMCALIDIPKMAELLNRSDRNQS